MEMGKLSSNPKLESLPPTDPAVELNIQRAHYQAIIWKSSLQNDPPSLDPTKVSFYYQNMYLP